MATLSTIHGFLLEPQTLSAEWGTVRIRETCLIEMQSPLDDIVDVQSVLPAFGNGTSPTVEPTFTIGLSYHPERTDLILKSADNVRMHEAGRPYWLVDLTYETAQWINEALGGISITESANPSKGNNKRPAKLTGNQTVIYPWDEPVIWSGGTKTVKATVYNDSLGFKLLHANGLPITEGIDIDITLEHHQFNWNLRHSAFDYVTDIAPYVGKINDAVIPDFGAAIAQSVLLESLTATENYRTVSIPVPVGQSSTGATETHHFFAMSASFLIDRRGTAQGYFREANRRVSMHTQQVVTDGIDTWLDSIPINDFGTVAKAPWPLLSDAAAAVLSLPDGAAVPYDVLDLANPETDFYIIDSIYPKTADLSAFVVANGLDIP